MREVKLGTTVTDSITGFSGIATSRTTYLHGCVRVFVEPTALKDGKPIEGSYFDEQRLIADSKAKTGGPGDAPPPRDAPRR